MNQKLSACTLRSCKTLLLLVAIATCLTTSDFGAAQAQPCATNAESRQLDYWLGNWTISAPGSSRNAISKVYLSLDKCLIVERWDGGRGHTGQNIFAYSPDDKSWYGMFADNQGRVHVFTSGKVSSGHAEFRGTSRDASGETVLNRVTVVRVARDKVEQIWEKSADNGARWKEEFRGEYSRANRQARQK